jgi:transcriptional regulator of heat shock response
MLTFKEPLKNSELMDQRKKDIFCAIVSQFISTATPVGSKTVLISYHLNISSATIRNDMAYLENEGLIYQPHTSAGRIPTDIGYRLYVDELIDPEEEKKNLEKEILQLKKEYRQRRIKERIYEAVSLLADTTQNISFATLPNKRTFYLGFSNILKKPEFQRDPAGASQIVEIFEKDDRFLDILNSLNITDMPKIFIGKENAIKQIQSCSLVVVKYTLEGKEGFLGILGPTRMNYPYCFVILEEIKTLMEENKNL